MDTYTLIAYLIYNFISRILTCRYADIFLKDKNKGKKVKFAAAFSYFIINSLLFVRFSSYTLNIATNIIPMFLYSFLYEGKLYKRIFYVVSVYSLSMVLEDFLYYFVSFLCGGLDLKAIIIFYIAFDLMYYIIYRLLKKIIVNLSNEDFRFKHMFPLLTVPIFIIFFIQIFVASEFEINKYVLFIFMFAISLLVFYCFYEIDKSYRNSYRERIAYSESQYYKNQLELIQKSERDLSKAKHDYKNHIVSLKNYMQNNDTEGGLTYIEQILENVDDSRRIVDCGNIVIDSLINYKLADYAEKGIELEVNLSVPKTVFAADYDLNIILGNLLDNAVTAAEQAEEKRISLTIRYYKGLLYIKNENTYSGEIYEKDGRILTTKNEKQHGYGIENIKEAISKYKGSMDISRTDSIFSVVIILYNN